MHRWLVSGLVMVALARASSAEEGYVEVADGGRLYYVKHGQGDATVILPARLFLFPEFRALGDSFIVIAYDMRNRGRSSFVQNGELLTLDHDVSDLEAVRHHFGVERFSTVGYSYLGKMVVIYAVRHPGRVDRIVQIGPVPMALGTTYPEGLRNDESARGRDSEERAKLRRLRELGFHLEQPERYCREEWLVTRLDLVGDPRDAEKLGAGPCAMPNEWPTNLVRHLFHHFGSMSRFDLAARDVAGVTQPVLTIHGKRDRNAPYGGGREWALELPDARLLTLEGSAHQVWADAPEVIPIIRRFLTGSDPTWPEEAEKVSALAPR